MSDLFSFTFSDWILSYCESSRTQVKTNLSLQCKTNLLVEKDLKRSTCRVDWSDRIWQVESHQLWDAIGLIWFTNTITMHLPSLKIVHKDISEQFTRRWHICTCKSMSTKYMQNREIIFSEELAKGRSFRISFGTILCKTSGGRH